MLPGQVRGGLRRPSDADAGRSLQLDSSGVTEADWSDFTTRGEEVEERSGAGPGLSHRRQRTGLDEREGGEDTECQENAPQQEKHTTLYRFSVNGHLKGASFPVLGL